MTKNDLVLKIAKEMNMHQTDIKRIVQMTFDGIIEVLATEGRLELRNFGVYEVKTRKPRKARNPRTGEEVMVPSRKSVTFKGGKFMTDRVNGLVEPQNRKGDEDL
ncbi:MAG: integration host factor subunit beta [Planctomycetaceae bacterium]|nr:integration host factor subunit beta [Planctomycetaceae bacterium]